MAAPPSPEMGSLMQTQFIFTRWGIAMAREGAGQEQRKVERSFSQSGGGEEEREGNEWYFKYIRMVFTH